MKPTYVQQVNPYAFCNNRVLENTKLNGEKMCGYRFKKNEMKVYNYCPMCSVEIDWHNVEENIW